MRKAFGVDLIEIKKARRFYKTHKNRLDSFFSPQEIAFIRAGERPHENLAILLASKEAVFKAVPSLGTGLAAFRNIEMIFHKGTPKKADLKFSILKNKQYVVVQCAGI